MKKKRLFPYWKNLQQVIAIQRSQEVNGTTLTLVSLESYAQEGFLLTFNFESSDQSIVFERLGRGWTQAEIVDETGYQYSGQEATIDGIAYKSIFAGRTVMVCRPELNLGAKRLSITIDRIRWEYLDSTEKESLEPQLTGPWIFNVSL